MRKVIFKSVKILEYKTTSFVTYKNGGYRSTSEVTYDMGSVRTHVLRVTHRQVFENPFTWLFSTFVGIVLGGISAIVVGGLGSFKPLWGLSSFVVGFGFAYLLCTLLYNGTSKLLLETACKERGCSTKERLAIIPEERWPAFVAKLRPKNAPPAPPLPPIEPHPEKGLGFVLLVAGIAGMLACLFKFVQEENGAWLFLLLICLIVTVVGALKSGLWRARDLSRRAHTLGLGSDTKPSEVSSGQDRARFPGET